MSKYATVITDNHVLVINTETGEDVKFNKDDKHFEGAIQCIKDGKPEEVFNMSLKHVVSTFFSVSDSFGCISVGIKNGNGIITLHDHGDMEVPLADAITNKIIKMNEQGFSCVPLLNFLARLYDNPSKSAIDELYLFIESCELPITEDGYFIAYKIVNSDYTDIYTGKMDNSIGCVPSMPRALVDSDRNRTCSQGLHFCSKGYLNAYGSSSKDSDRCMLVKISPADVVAIPSDYHNAKGRAWQYEVVSELPAGWRKVTHTKDYTDKAVVATNGKDIVLSDEEIKSLLHVWRYVVSADSTIVDIDEDVITSIDEVVNMIGKSTLTVERLKAYVDSLVQPASFPFPVNKVPKLEDELSLAVKNLISEFTGFSAPNFDTRIDSLGLDSLDIIEVIMALEEEYNIEIPDDEVENIVTVNDVIESVRLKILAKVDGKNAASPLIACTHCGSSSYISKGMNSARTKRRFKCKECDGTFYD